jgi:hypothetical protein
MFIKEGMKPQFEEAFNKAFGDCYLLLSREQAFEKRLFGPGMPHPRSIGFIGDYLAIATGTVGICYDVPKDGEMFKAAHAGLTADEMNVPFIVYESKRTK